MLIKTHKQRKPTYKYDYIFRRYLTILAKNKNNPPHTHPQQQTTLYKAVYHGKIAF